MKKLMFLQVRPQSILMFQILLTQLLSMRLNYVSTFPLKKIIFANLIIKKTNNAIKVKKIYNIRWALFTEIIIKLLYTHHFWLKNTSKISKYLFGS